MTFNEMVDVIADCRHAEYEFSITEDRRGSYYLQASYLEPDTVTGEVERQLTRRRFLNPEMTRSEIVQTAFKCVMTSMEHRAREWFKYRGKPVFGPHFDVEALWELCESERFETRVVPQKAEP